MVSTMLYRALCFLSLLGFPLAAQTSGTAFFRAVLLPSSEVPPVSSSNRGVADLFASVARDSSGQIISGTVDFLVRPNFTAAATVTALDLRSGAAGQNGAVALTTGLSTATPFPIASGSDVVHIPVQITGADPAALAALRGLFQNPGQYYVNLATTASPNGAVRGQLQPAQAVVLLGLLSSSNVVTAPSSFGSGVAQVVALATRDTSGNLTSGEVYMSAVLFSLDPTPFTAFHIHTGPAGATGAIAITAPLPSGMQTDPNGNAQITALYSEATVTNTTQAGAITNLFGNPGALYVDLHSSGNPNGMVRAQLRPTSRIDFGLLLDSANEAAAPSVKSLSPAALSFFTLRNEDGTLAAATAQLDLDYRFPGPVNFLGAWLHDAPAHRNGPVSYLLASDFSTASGFGNYFAWTLPLPDLDSLDDVTRNPENHYLELHTFPDPAGAARAQLAPPVTATAAVSAVLPATLDPAATAIAPGSLIAIFGSNLAKVPADLKGWQGSNVPIALNGIRVTIANRPAPLLYIGPGQINAQVPADVVPGKQQLFVDNGNGPGASFTVTVAPSAPTIFASAILKNANYSVVSSANPAKAGDILILFATGLSGAGLPTGLLAPLSPLAATDPVTATIGGKPANVIYSLATPGTIGVYQIALTVPTGVASQVPLVIQQGSASSSPVTLP